MSKLAVLLGASIIIIGVSYFTGIPVVTILNGIVQFIGTFVQAII
jgi:hypothetical protein